MGGDEPFAVIVDEFQQIGLLLVIKVDLAVPIKKMASTLLRLGPPLAGWPVVILGWYETIFESVGM